MAWPLSVCPLISQKSTLSSNPVSGSALTLIEFLGRLSEIAGNTEVRQAQFAIEALGNLYVQANLLESQDLIDKVGSCGLLSLLE